MSLRPRRALLGLVTAAAVLALLPAVASATITPALTLNQTAGTTAASTTTIGFNATFSPTPGDSVKDLTLAFPAGLLANENIAGGACLASATPSAACQVGTGTVTTSALGTQNVTLYLVAPPKPTDVGGVAVVLGTSPGTPTSVADVSLGATGLSVAFTNLPNLGISAINASLTGLRLPTSCPTPAANVTLTADSQLAATPATTTAPLTVSGCSGLPYSPKLTAAIAADSKGNAALTLVITQAANEAASKTIAVAFPSGLTPNAGPLIPCLNATGCKIGTATATSPLIPGAALGTGTVTLSGSVSAPTFEVAFPAPLALTINGIVNLSTNSVTFSNVPDIPLSSLTLNITGPNGQRAFTTNCKPANVTGTFTAQGGQTHTSTAPITFSGCVVKPSVSASTGGLATGHPTLKFKVAHGSGGPNVASMAIGLPSGLRFSHSAFVTKKTCVTKSKKKKCTTTTLIKGLAISGAKAKSVSLKGGKLVITLKKAAGSVTISVSGPLVTETTGLQTQVKKHKVKTLNFTLTVTDTKHTTTSTTLKLKAH